MALLPSQTISEAGAAVTLVAAAVGGDTYDLTDSEAVLVVRNADASSKTVTVVTPGTVSGLAIADRALVIAAGAFALLPLDKGDYRDPATGLASITYSAVTSVTVGVVRFG
jgi:hypothetical protein